MLYNLMHWPAK